MTKKHVALTLILCAVLSVSFACKKGGLAGLAPVSGVVLYNGEPVADAQLMFMPDAGGENSRSGNARTNADGTFDAMTLAPKDGLFPGTYKISVRKMTEPPKAEVEIGEDGERDDLAVARQAHLKDEVQDLLPMQYAAPATSGLTITVEKKGVKDFKIELTD